MNRRLALYQQAGRLIDDDPRYAVWPSRVLADIYSANMNLERASQSTPPNVLRY